MIELKVTNEELDVIIHALEDFIDIEQDRLRNKTLIASKLVDHFKLVLSTETTKATKQKE